MKKTVVSLLAALLLAPATMQADGYTQLWKKVEEAAKKDLPRTQIEHLQTISAMAEKEKNYGQMLKAEWNMMYTWGTISRDSLAPQLKRLEQKADSFEQTDPALAAVCYAALGKTCSQRRMRANNTDTLAQAYFKKAMADPAMLASKKAGDYEPFTVEGRDAAIFGNDLLSLIGYTAEDYKAMHDYYATTTNRTATMLTALDMVKQQAQNSGDIYIQTLKGSRYAASLDSLTNLYGDLEACGEVALEKYAFYEGCIDVDVEQRVKLIEESLSRWEKWPRMETLHNAMKMLTNPMFSVDISRNVILPEKPFTIRMDVRNTNKLTFTLTRLNTDGREKRTPENNNDLKALKALAVKDATHTYTRTYTGRKDYETVKDSLVIDGLPVGVYLLEASTENKKVEAERSLLYVTDMYVVHQALPGNKTRVAALSGTTGQPVPGVTLYIGKEDGKERTVTCDAKGETVLNDFDKRDMYIRACTPTDNAMPPTSAYNRFSWYDADNDRTVASLYADRKIYRPGQTVHVAAVVRKIEGLTDKAVSGKTIKLTLRDANYKTVAEKTVTTDAYGTASTDFVLPSNGLTGSFTVRTETSLGGVATFRVEEYKRPTFEVEFDKVNEEYANGDTITVTGRAKSYSGVAVQGAKVKYTVSRKQALWWRFSYWGLYLNEADNTVLAEGEAVTDGNGEFKIKMPMTLPVWEENCGVTLDVYKRIARFYNIITEADVTDVAGESHEGTISLPLGSKSTAFDCEFPEKTLRDSLKTVTFTLRNAAGNDVDGDVTYTVSGIDGTFTAKANTATGITWNTAAQLKSGKHTLTAICGNDTIRRDFVVFSYEDTTPCVETPDWFYISGDEFPRDGSPVYMQFGSSDADVHVLYTVISGDKVLKSGTLELDGEVTTRKFAYKEEYGNGLRINLVWVKNGQAYMHNEEIRKPLPDKRLIVKWGTFRDRLTPGQQEEWTLNVTKPDGTPADAQLLATMYDYSLEQLAPFSWSFPSYMSISLPYTHWSTPYYRQANLYSSMDLKLANVPQLDFGYIAIEPEYYSTSGNVFATVEEVSYGSTRSIKLRKAVKGASIKNTAPVIKKDSEVKTKTTIGAYDVQGNDELGGSIMKSDAASSEAEGNPDAGVQLRENLNETAFFYPALQTDSTGNVTVKFTLPESVTIWRFMGLAHDKDMNNGMVYGKAVASKKVMVQPNMPRFVRVGDRATIAARIFNTSENAVKGTAIMQMVDPETEKVVLELKQKFEVAADSTGNVSFSYNPDNSHTLLVCRIFAEGKDFSDGEQHYLPILPDAELVTNTVPFTQHGPGVKTIDLKQLFPDGGSDEKLTVEYTNNPAWLTIQALPYINNAREDNAISLAVAYYANSISAYLMKQSPRIRSVFEQWKREAGQESLKSNLEKNQELKDIVLDETPWVADAERESDQKQMLANYFDSSTLANNLSTTLEKLSKLQSKEDGSWCWWPGMRYGSITLTAAVTETLVRLDKMTGKQADTQDMINNAMKFLGNKLVEEYEELKERKDKDATPIVFVDNSVHYLYICALNGRQLSAKEKEAANYVLESLKENNAVLNLYYKALMAVVLAKHGETQLAGEYIKSLDEYTVATEEMGRYYDSPRSGYSWFDYRIPTQVAAIEAMKLVDEQGYAKSIEEMRRWLLMQKRVQAWDTPFNNVNAVYAFLDGNMTELDGKEETTLSVDGKKLDLPQATAGLGYVKTTTDYEGGNTFTANKLSKGTSWGAIYGQSLCKTSSIESSNAAFRVTREILDENGRPATNLKVGDRVTVRITINADRDYDYVQVKDKRAACMEPVGQLSGYRRGYYCAPKDNATYYYYDRMSKGTHVIETEYYIDRAGRYETGTCTASCAYAPEYSARAASQSVEIK